MLKKFLRPSVLAAIAVVALTGIFGPRMLLGPKVHSVLVTRGDLTQTIVSSGKVIAASRVAVGSQVVGTVAAVDVQEGEQVKDGQLLARLRDEEQRAALEQARANLVEAQAKLNQLAKLSAPVTEQDLRQAEANLDLARREYERVKSLHAAGFFSDAKLEEAERNLRNAESQEKSALAQAITNRPQGADYLLAISREAQSRAALEVAQARLDYARIQSPVTGVVLRRLVEPGELVQPGKVLFDLGAGEIQLSLQVDEKNLGLLGLGQQAVCAADAYPGRTFTAEIFYIAPGIDPQRGTVEVKLSVPSPPDFLRTDMTISAELQAGSRHDVVMLDSNTLRDASTQPWVLVVRDGRAQRQAVKLGVRGSGKTEILDGLTPGEPVIPPSEAAVKPGQRVRASVA
jgi:HlyD family secretion protein